MKVAINTRWTGKMSFESIIGNHKLVMDASPENGGEDKGVRPKPLIMSALAGCTGMDAVSLLAKMRVEYKSLNILTEGELAEDHPKKYNTILVVFEFEGDNMPADKVEKAIAMSKDKYCGVAATLMPGVKVTYEIRINGVSIKTL